MVLVTVVNVYNFILLEVITNLDLTCMHVLCVYIYCTHTHTHMSCSKLQITLRLKLILGFDGSSSGLLCVQIIQDVEKYA